MTINPRLKRLIAEYEKIREISERSQFIQILEVEGNPPEKYLLRLTCKGISSIGTDGQPIISEDHRLGIYLNPEFPRTGPVFQFMTPLWHPNIGANGAVCYGDEGDHGYSPSMGLDDLVLRVVQMIRYENMGLDSAFNIFAAQWANQHRNLFPLDTRQIIEEKIDIGDITEINIVTSGDSNPDNNMLDNITISE